MKKNIIKSIISILLIIILIFLIKNTYSQAKWKKQSRKMVQEYIEKNINSTFSINKITFFTSCDAKNKTGSKSNYTIENLYAYTDIAIFIDNNQGKSAEENTLKSLKISNIKFVKEPDLGEPNLYFKSINDFAKSEIKEENKIGDELNFTISSQNNVDLTKPILYNNCANPITLSYINQNIRTDYTMLDTENPITYNGKLLERCNVELEKIKASISFDIDIENNKGQKFKTTISTDIPYENNNKSIYDGNLRVDKDIKNVFIRYE